MRLGWKDTIAKSLWCSGGSEKIMMAKDSFIALWHGGQGEEKEVSNANWRVILNSVVQAHRISLKHHVEREIYSEVLANAQLSASIVLAICRTRSVGSVISSRRTGCR